MIRISDIANRLKAFLQQKGENNLRFSSELTAILMFMY